MRTSQKTNFRKLKITLVTMTYHNQHPQVSLSVPSCSLVASQKPIFKKFVTFFERKLRYSLPLWTKSKPGMLKLLSFLIFSGVLQSSELNCMHFNLQLVYSFSCLVHVHS